MDQLPIGRLLRANAKICVVGCSSQQTIPAMGMIVKIPIPQIDIFGVIYDMRINDVGVVRQLSVAGDLPDEVLQDNLNNRNAPIEISIAFVGYIQNDVVMHMLPPHPPLSLEKIYYCDEDEIRAFTDPARTRYIRHLLTLEDAPIPDLVAKHLSTAVSAQHEEFRSGWINAAMHTTIQLVKDNPALLIPVLNALADAFPEIQIDATGEYSW